MTRQAWYQAQAVVFGEMVTRFCTASGETPLSAVHYTRLAAHFGRLALGQTRVREEFSPQTITASLAAGANWEITRHVAD